MSFHFEFMAESVEDAQRYLKDLVIPEQVRSFMSMGLDHAMPPAQHTPKGLKAYIAVKAFGHLTSQEGVNGTSNCNIDIKWMYGVAPLPAEPHLDSTAAT